MTVTTLSSLAKPVLCSWAASMRRRICHCSEIASWLRCASCSRRCEILSDRPPCSAFFGASLHQKSSPWRYANAADQCFAIKFCASSSFRRTRVPKSAFRTSDSSVLTTGTYRGHPNPCEGFTPVQIRENHALAEAKPLSRPRYLRLSVFMATCFFF